MCPIVASEQRHLHLVMDLVIRSTMAWDFTSMLHLSRLLYVVFLNMNMMIKRQEIR